MIAQIQQTWFLIIIVGIIVAWADKEGGLNLPDWVKFIVVPSWIIGFIVLIVTTLIRIWS